MLARRWGTRDQRCRSWLRVSPTDANISSESSLPRISVSVTRGGIVVASPIERVIGRKSAWGQGSE